MNSPRPFPSIFLIPACLGLSPMSAMACAVCYGDPDSLMAKGAVSGILVLAGVIAAVLTGVAGTGVFWIYRSRRLDSFANVRSPDTAHQ